MDVTQRPVKPVGRRRSCTNYATRTLIDNWPDAPVWGRDQGPYKHAAPQRIPARFVVCVKNPLKWLLSYGAYEARFLQMPADQVVSQLYHRERVEAETEAWVTKYAAWLDEMHAHGGAVVQHEAACQDEERVWRDVAEELELAWPPPKHGRFQGITKRVAPSNTGRKQPVEYEPPDYELHTYVQNLSQEQVEAVHRALDRSGATGHGGLLQQLGYGTRLREFLERGAESPRV